MMGVREHPVRTSLTRFVGSAPADQNTIDGLAERAYRENGGVYFTKAALDRMSWQARELIEAEAKRIFGKRSR